MPPKRKAARGGKAAGGKKAKIAEPDPQPEASTVKEAFEALKTKEKGKKKSYKVDAQCPYSNTAQVVDDYDCMLNQTNIGANNNKYYIIQVLVQNGQYFSWNRWGRVGEPGQNAMKPFANVDQASSDFKKKFKDKTKNAWDKRDTFTPVPGKYTMLEMDGDDDDADDTREKLAKLDEVDGIKRITSACTLNKPTQELIKLIFDNDTFHHAMKEMEIDVKKMPLGKLSKAQISKGFDVLEDLESAINQLNRAQLEQLTSRFFTLIPHDFGRQRPPVLNTVEAVRKKKDMLLVLADIEAAQAMQKDEKKKASFKGDTEKEPHPMDVHYQMLDCDLEILDKKGKEFKILETYLKSTEGGWRKIAIEDIFKVNRHKEGDRFLAHDKLGNRKLLWHGTNVAVVAAILKGGLRIMPHSGGRVGKGIYFASENGKSAGYVRTSTNNTGIMFLNEVVLGKEHHILQDDWTLTDPPIGFDSIVAKGHTEPDPKLDVTLKIENHTVTVPQGKPISQPAFAGSYFSQSEYLVYKESQNRIRYLLKLKM